MDLKYQTILPRISATIIDAIILWPLSFLTYWIDLTANNNIYILLTFLLSILYTSYFIIFHFITGQTIGKMFMKVIVLNAKDEFTKLKIGRSIIRESPVIIAEFLVLLYLLLTNSESIIDIRNYFQTATTIIGLGWLCIELLTMILNNKRRSIQDLIATSVVLKKDV